MVAPSIQTFTVDWPHLPDLGQPLLAIGHTLPTQWWLVRPTVPSGEYELRELSRLSIIATADPAPPRLPNGHHIVALKNYSENEGILERLENAGIVRRTGVVHEQGYVKIPMVELLIPEERLIQHCSSEGCGKWEVLEQPRFQRCSLCKLTYYCSQKMRPFVSSAPACEGLC